MSELNRRNFLAASAGAATWGTTLAQVARADDTPPAPPQMPIGKTGIVMSRVGQGTGMHGGNRQSDHTRKGFKNFVALMQHAYDRGVTFFDLADLYGSHVYFREALKTIPRDKISILTKIWTRYDEACIPDAPDYCKQVAKTTLDRFCHEIATDHLDIVLLHCMISSNWPDQLAPYMEALDEAKQQGQVRAVGVSCHDLQAVVTAASSPWVDVILARINPFGAKMDGKLEEVVPVLTQARQNGKAILGMKIYGEGTLVDKKEECIQFAQENGLLDAMTVGAETPAQMDETLRLVAKYPAQKLKG